MADLERAGLFAVLHASSVLEGRVESTPTSNAARRDASPAECHRIYESQH